MGSGATPYRVIRLDAVGSTSDEAMARLRSGKAGGFFVTAVSQTQGRGRHGRVWSSPPGNLYASLALVDPAPPAVASQLGFVAGVALAKVLRTRLGGDPRLAIKWPNDMVFAGAKLAGILVESTALRDGRLGCVVGFGVNCLSHPDHLDYPATDLRAAGDPEVEASSVLIALAGAMASWLEVWDSGKGFAKIRHVWLEHAADVGRRIEVALPRKRVSGIFRDLAADGCLVIENAEGSVMISTGDVFPIEGLANDMQQKDDAGEP